MIPAPPTAPPATRRWNARVLSLKRLSSSGYLLSLSRDDLPFLPGQLVNLYGADPLHERSYTICSGPNDPTLDILFRHIPTGLLTPQLVALHPGQTVPVLGPLGEFTLRDPHAPSLFIATGTGIAPARAYLRGHPSPALTILHGVRHPEDLFFRNEFAATDYTPCVSSAPGHGHHGRVTTWLTRDRADRFQAFYLCGANEMIYEVRDTLLAWNVPPHRIYTEAYYYRADD
ncbi:MAG TPA: FAD-dependent oxidoreductase [Kiritimatiellia bacterium]|nr:FAD-dependent oxidoreductase [Kiritimatiellia bacterium]